MQNRKAEQFLTFVLGFTLTVSLFVGPGFARDGGVRDTDVDTETLEPVTVESKQIQTFEETEITSDQSISASPDPAELMKNAPGGNVASNGPVSGQVQYRGMTGPRMNVRVDGMYINSGGPNLMDPPLHYLPKPLMESLEVERGISSVSSGNMTLGGTVRARTKTSEFTNTDEFQVSGDIEGIGRSVDDGFTGGGIISYANRNMRFHVLGSTEQGDDREIPDGEVVPTEHEKETSGLGFGFRDGDDEYSFNFRHVDTDNSGNPSLPMDIRFLKSELLNGKYEGNWGKFPVTARLFYTDIDHKMDNETLRPDPGDPNSRFVLAQSEGLGYKLETRVPAAGGQWTLGLDGHVGENNMQIFNPDNSAFFVDNFNDAEKDRYGVYAGWNGPLNQIVPGDWLNWPSSEDDGAENPWELTVSGRYTRVDMSVGGASLGAMPAAPPVVRIKDSFNAGDRSEEDDNVDAVIALNRQLNRNLDVEIALGRKTRSPSYLERFAWLPIEATAGLADGNNHIGDPQLEPEVSHDVEFGLNWQWTHSYVTPRLYYRDVNDYIQGTPFDNTVGVIDSDVERVSNVNGDPTPLQWSNVDANIYGIDLSFGHKLPMFERWSIDGTLSFARGERDDINDDLYRFPPLTGNARLSYRRNPYRITFETEFADEQDDVSETNGETETPGYGVLNIGGEWKISEKFRINASWNNVFDKTYRDHLAGFNRIDPATSQTDVGLGRRIPGNGTNGQLHFVYNW